MNERCRITGEEITAGLAITGLTTAGRTTTSLTFSASTALSRRTVLSAAASLSLSLSLPLTRTVTVAWALRRGSATLVATTANTPAAPGAT